MPDFIYHGLFAGLVFWNDPNFKKAIMYGLAPDLISFGAYGLYEITHDFKFDLTKIPWWKTPTYNIGHSIIIWLSLYLLLYFFFGINEYPMFAAIISILVDIPLHSYKKGFPTPFLWPLSNYKVDGIQWSRPPVLIISYIVLYLFYRYRIKQ